MGTKLRNSSTSSMVKIVAFLIAVISLTSTIVVFELASLTNIDPECMIEKQYENSDAFQEEVVESLNLVAEYYYRNSSLQEAPFLYYLEVGGGIYTNTDTNEESFFANAGPYYKLDNGIWRRGNTETDEIIKTDFYSNKRTNALVAFPDEFFQQRQKEWSANREEILPYAIAGSTLSLISIALVIFLILIAGKQSQNNQIHLNKFDLIYSDLILFIFVFIGMFFIKYLPLILDDNRSVGIRIDRHWTDFFTNFKEQFLPSLFLFSSTFLIFITIFLSLILSLIRVMKAGLIIKNSLLYKVIRASKHIITDIYRYLFYGNVFHEDSLTKILYYRQLVVIVSTASMFFLSFLCIMFETALYIIPVMLQIAVLIWYAKGNRNLFADIETDIQNSLNDQVKSERTKMALITNVSHDLKTPLTSIISYIDLLAQEEELSETAMDYIKILQAKSDRLKNIVIDLFDLAKSTSGDVKLDYEVIDLKRLMEQTLVEMEDKIETSKLQIKTRLPETQVNIKSDGKRLYRVFQNVIDNALKYSMKGTRIYIDLEIFSKEAIVTIRNIAGYEMNFTSEEILQRFTRGDEARSEEGSGLGLSIAESFTKVCGGDFKVEIDGDLFKVKLFFEIASDESNTSVA